MPLYSTVCPLPINRKIFRHRGSVSPIPQSGLALWLKADAGTTTQAEQFISQIVISGAETTTSDGTYTRASGGTTSFSGPNGNTINFDSVDNGLLFFIYDADFGDTTYSLIINYTSITSIGISNGASPAPTATTSLTATGNFIVTAWADQSGNGNNFTQASGIVVKSNNVIGPNPAILFDGGNLVGSNIETAKTIYAVIKTLGDSAMQYAVILETTGGGLYSAINGTEWGSYFSASLGAGETISTNTAAIIATISDDGATYEYRRNGQQVLTNTDGGGFYSRSSAFLGNDGSSGQPANVYVSEIIVYDRVPTSNEIEQIETYLNTKYAIY